MILYMYRAFTTVLSGIGEQFSPSRYPGITSGYINDVSCVCLLLILIIAPLVTEQGDQWGGIG